MRLAFMDSPITRAELAHQRRSFHRSPRQRWLLTAAISLALIISAAFIWEAATGDNSNLVRVNSIADIVTIPAGILGVVVFTFHLGLLFQSITLSVNSIYREKHNRTWENLLLSSLSSRSIIIGKWWATVRHLWLFFLLAGVLRGGLIVWWAKESHRVFEDYGHDLGFTPLQTLLVMAILATFNLLNLSFTASLGVLTSLFTRRGGIAFVMGLALYILTLVILGSLPIIATAPTQGIRSLFFQLLSATNVDSGSTLAIYLPAYILSYRDFQQLYVNTLLLSLGLQMIPIVLALLLAQFVAVRQGALPPVPVRASEPHRAQ